MVKKEKKKSCIKEIEKEAHSLTHTRARAKEPCSDSDFTRQVPSGVPTLDQVLAHALICGINDPEFIRSWYADMTMAFWCNEHGNPIKNWGYVLQKWFRNKKRFERLRDPERIPDARKSATYSGRKADNFLEASEEIRKDFDDVLG